MHAENNDSIFKEETLKKERLHSRSDLTSQEAVAGVRYALQRHVCPSWSHSELHAVLQKLESVPEDTACSFAKKEKKI